ncbi:GNAT family N-acetyltransferase [Duganella sp. Root1480D1]|uniref:GNAT family N-acetyltransferase n=1 Tax=Duganella sp. Root1480D1 TaxID=1736471 RepID=UPI000708F26C|nr:GNAT family N-acetyltransferase [Duganella sp. Root1480D1]KQZ40020.1 GCN5 family acetyltransferase [Duganella sp. Root1480D1]
MNTRLLTPGDAAAYHSLRLEGLREAPSAFTASFEEESTTPLSEIARRLSPGSGRDYLGAFDGGTLIAIARVDRDSGPKQRHRAHIRAVYVASTHRGKGAARKLMEHALECAASMQGVTHVSLAVTAGNEPAQKLYESLGFKAWGYEPAALIVDGVTYDEIPMTKVLEPST